MAAQSNAAALRRGYDAFSTGDMDTLRNQIFSSDIVWHQGGRNQTSGDYRGADAVLGLFGKLHQLTDGTFAVELHDVLASDEHVVALATTKGQRGGKTIKNGQYSHICHFRDGKLSEAWIVDVDPYEIDEFFA
ncbi:MAG: nuclear transport factor 2 family protein [Chloroflexi bacterium]|nr:nuclear transport factor 2 family protein [Chloroflexota bacterium]